MTALAKERMRKVDKWNSHVFTLKSGTKGYKGGACCLDTATGKVLPGAAGTGLVFIGVFAETVDAASADSPVNVDLMSEVTLEWFINDTGGTPVSSTTGILSVCYVLDDQTVTGAPAGNAIAGIVWAVDSVRGVAVQRVSGGKDSIFQNGTLPAYASNDSVPTSIVSGASYDVPTTAAASTITLPAASPDGAWAVFTADGTKNGHTVQYRDATGPTNLTTALTASKRHLVYAIKRGGKWFANAYVSP